MGTAQAGKRKASAPIADLRCKPDPESFCVSLTPNH
jgi:hypothetical protein